MLLWLKRKWSTPAAACPSTGWHWAPPLWAWPPVCWPYLNVSNIAGVAVQLQKKDPEKYPEPEGTINGNLIIDSTLTYFSSVAGIGMGLLNIAAGVGTVYLGMKSGS